MLSQHLEHGSRVGHWFRIIGKSLPVQKLQVDGDMLPRKALGSVLLPPSASGCSRCPWLGLSGSRLYSFSQCLFCYVHGCQGIFTLELG